MVIVKIPLLGQLLGESGQLVPEPADQLIFVVYALAEIRRTLIERPIQCMQVVHPLFKFHPQVDFILVLSFHLLNVRL